MRLAAVIAAAAFVVPAANAGVLLGVHGNAARFAAQTGQQSQIHHTFMTYGNGSSLRKIVSTMGPVPLLALNATSDTPRAIALGQTDALPRPAQCDDLGAGPETASTCALSRR